MTSDGLDLANGEVEPKTENGGLNCRQQLEIFKEAKKRSQVQGRTEVYLLSSGWYRKWETTAEPGETCGTVDPIDNSDLLNGQSELQRVLIEGQDYLFVGKEEWKMLHAWFGGGPAIKREVIFNGFEEMVELYKLDLEVEFREERVTMKGISKGMRVSDLKTAASIRFPEADPLNLELYFEGEEYGDSIRGDKTVFQAQIQDRMRLVLERPSRAMYTDFLANGNGYKQPSLQDYKANDRAGLTGLKNLGNTCFMNSALQCLSNTEKLTEFFLSGKYESEINEDNPIGRQGNLAREYATVLRNLWTALETSYAPRGLKFQVGQYAPQFNGYAQQDSQEFMAFLMDGLHEDLNRILKKPLIEAIEGGGKKPDNEVSALSWENHRKRNDSIIVDLFHGQYKSTVVCPTCDKISVTFDPFMYLTLPLPAAAERNIDILFIPNPRVSPAIRPVKYCMKTQCYQTKVRDVKEYIAEKTRMDPSKLIVTTKLASNRLDFRLQYTDNEELSESQLRMTLMAFEVNYNTSDTGLTSALPAAPNSLLDVDEDPVIILEIQQLFGDEDMQFVATPQIMTLRRSECTGARLSEEVQIRVEKHFDSAQYFNRLDTEEGPPQQPYRLRVQNKGLHSYQEMAKEEVRQDSNDVLETVKKQLRASLLVEWLPELEIKDFWDYEVANGKSMVEDESVKRLRTQKLIVTLDECMRFWEKEETLTEQNSWYCPKCREHKPAKKSLKLWKAPETLVIHLKRFSYSTWSRHKVDLFVDFPLESFDLQPYIAQESELATDESLIYDLYAVVNHMGNLGGGHYNAYAISPWKDRRWYSFDDSTVSAVAIDSIVKSPNAYLLFYRRRAQQSMM